jgi:maltooligosyltrehalose trehalohydrolase
MRFGAAYHQGAARFHFWAPACDRVALRIDGQPDRQMQPRPGGWFEVERPCRPGARYRFVLPDGLAIPDPASRAQAEGVHGWSLVVDPQAYRWQHATPARPWHEAVIWEAHAGLLGGFDGLRARLPELAGLGITAIELMPIGAFPGARNWGYDGVLLFAPAEAYGPPASLKALIDEAHRLGLSMLLDVVYNHFGPDGNYLRRTAPQFFTHDRKTAWGDAIDFVQPEVAEFFTQNALYWLEEYRFDGLRLDAVQAILPHPALPTLGRAIRAGVESRKPRLILENERNEAELLGGHLFTAQWNDDLHHCLHVLLTGETEAYYADYAEAPAELLARCLREGFAYQGETSVNLGHPRGTPSFQLPPTAFVSFTQNHDHIGNRAMGERLLALADPEAVRAAMALVLLCPQIPMLFMGEEIGSRSPFLFFTDHNAELAEAVRYGRRAEFGRFAAFADVANRAAIPDPNAESTFTASIPAPADDGFDWPGFIRTLLSVRAAHVAPHLPGSHAIAAAALGPAAVAASWRLGDGGTLHLACNLGRVTLPWQPPPGAQLIAATASAAAGSLPARSTLAWRRQAEAIRA